MTNHTASSSCYLHEKRPVQTSVYVHPVKMHSAYKALIPGIHYHRLYLVYSQNIIAFGHRYRIILVILSLFTWTSETQATLFSACFSCLYTRCGVCCTFQLIFIVQSLWFLLLLGTSTPAICGFSLVGEAHQWMNEPMTRWAADSKQRWRAGRDSWRSVIPVLDHFWHHIPHVSVVAGALAAARECGTLHGAVGCVDGWNGRWRRRNKRRKTVVWWSCSALR